ncbi:D-alanine--D-alanine ligase [Patescibacteria group bacterium]|nr:D-alanine--D-alanine ligase [Patescibacteria group bacterium]MBU1702831.1 D-alanine--D-alanine ligase [Patescibacteria group bacterium]MBU1954281.1 D-alanine--D-alanine ligase [Patescibacteria group bacterium]
MNKQMRIEIVVTNTVGLDLMPRSTVKAVKESLEKNFQNVKVTNIKTEIDLKNLISRKPDLVFSGVKYLGFNEEDKKRTSKNKIWLSSILKEHGINHTGSETEALALEINKVKAKKALLKLKIPTAKFFTAFPGQFNKQSVLPVSYPLFIKPMYEGDSRGIDEGSVVRNFSEFKAKVKQLHNEHHDKVLVEKYLSGREFTVGIIRDLNTKKLEAYPVELIAQINSRGYRFLSKKDKKEDSESVIQIIDIQLFKQIAKLAKQSFRALGARDYGRIDFRMDQNNRLFFLEANLVPGMGKGYFSRAMKMVKKESYSKMVNNLASIALCRAR